MTALDVMALATLAMMAVMFIAIFIVLGGLPGRIAHKRGHPNAKAIQIGGWATLLLAVVGWPFVLMWAMAETSTNRSPENRELGGDGLDYRLSELSERVSTLESKLKEG